MKETKVIRARGTAYCPEDSLLEGGFFDRFGRPLFFLQQAVAGDVPYCSVAMDKDAFPGDLRDTVIRIPEIEQAFGKIILFKVCDTGGAFNKPGIHRERIDICVQPGIDPLTSQPFMNDPVINGPLTLLWLPELNFGDPFPVDGVGDMVVNSDK